MKHKFLTPFFIGTLALLLLSSCSKEKVTNNIDTPEEFYDQYPKDFLLAPLSITDKIAQGTLFPLIGLGNNPTGKRRGVILSFTDTNKVQITFDSTHSSTNYIFFSETGGSSSVNIELNNTAPNIAEGGFLFTNNKITAQSIKDSKKACYYETGYIPGFQNQVHYILADNMETEEYKQFIKIGFSTTNESTNEKQYTGQQCAINTTSGIAETIPFN